jgi:hypothetical protein
MDIGLDRFLEMVEKRWGRFWSGALMAVIYLGIAAICLPLIWNNLFVPIYHFFLPLVQGIASWQLPKLEFGKTWKEAAAGVFSVAVGIFVSVLFSLITRFLEKTWQTMIAVRRTADAITKISQHTKKRKVRSQGKN